LGTGGSSGTLWAGGGGRAVPGRRRALVEESMLGGGREGPVDDMEPVEAERPRV
jgi:hypothetical protein